MSKVNQFKKPVRPTWYYIERSECPVCGHKDSVRTPKYSPKPKQNYKRGSFKMEYCGCYW